MDLNIMIWCHLPTMMAPVNRADIPLAKSTIPGVGNHGMMVPKRDSRIKAIPINRGRLLGRFWIILPLTTDPRTIKSALRENITETDSGVPPVTNSRSTIVGATKPSFIPWKAKHNQTLSFDIFEACANFWFHLYWELFTKNWTNTPSENELFWHICTKFCS